MRATDIPTGENSRLNTPNAKEPTPEFQKALADFDAALGPLRTAFKQLLAKRNRNTWAEDPAMLKRKLRGRIGPADPLGYLFDTRDRIGT